MGPVCASSNKGDRRQSSAVRRGMTLIEILIAIGILSLGMMGIAALFHLAVRNVSTASHRSTAAAVVRNALASLRSYSLDLSLLDAQYGGLDLSDPADGNILDFSDVRLTGAAGSALSRALAYYYDPNQDGTPDHPIAHGVHADSFLIPEDVVLHTIPAGEWGGATRYVPCAWARDFGWTAVLRPMPLDDDDPPDGLADEDGPGGLPDPPNVGPTSIWQVQIAVWRDYELLEDIGTPSVTFHANSTLVDIGGTPSTEFWNKLKPGDWIRNVGYGIWYRIAEVDEDFNRLFLANRFSHPFDDGSGLAPEDVEFASRFHLITVYNATIAP